MKTEKPKLAKIKKIVVKKRTVKSKTVKKTEKRLLQPMMPAIVAMPAEIKKQVHKMFPRPLDFEIYFSPPPSNNYRNGHDFGYVILYAESGNGFAPGWHRNGSALFSEPISFDYSQEIFSEFDDTITLFMSPPTPKSIKETENFIATSLQGMEAGKELVCVVLKKDTREFLGCIGLHELFTATPELGIWIKKSGHGYGYGKEAVAGLKKWADKNLICDYYVYPVVEDNLPSRNVAEFLGGEIIKKYAQTTGNGRTYNFVDYKIPFSSI